jgi:hypothetical protein
LSKILQDNNNKVHIAVDTEGVSNWIGKFNLVN